ncbi:MULTISPECIES: hypothetical protein [Klebsiella pneumoniae complex]|uniref:hypothetical protein n=1 Tax=Klebsiella variicola TaxID=244366 RepID=UPI00149599FF|nr:hypothetical protein [Klebsiella variicola]MCM6717778.1 hypothetical protein [Klebsiella pneumoniae]
MKHKHLDCLMQDLHNISQMIADDILQRSEAAREVQEVLDTMRMTLLNRKCPSSRLAEYAVCLLRAERYRQVRIYGKSLREVRDLSLWITGLKAFRRRLEKTEETWRYRQWEASRAAYSLAGLFILPAYLIFSLAVGVGCDLRISSVILGGYLVYLTGVAVRAKDCVAIYWSLYSFIPLVMLN